MRRQSTMLALVLTGILFCFQNCSNEGFKSAKSSLTMGSSADSGSTSNVPSTISPDAIANGILANRVTDCFTNADYNTCLFWKNPIAFNMNLLSQPIGRNTNLSLLQVHGVNIARDDYDNSGFLVNPHIDVAATNLNGNQLVLLERVSTRTGSFKFNYGNDVNHKFSQVMAFYWLNFQRKYMTQRVGSFYASNKGISVASYVPTYDNAAWDYMNEFIFIGERPNLGPEYSLGAEIYLHEMGHANAGYASNRAIYNGTSAVNMRACSQQFPDERCCADNRGCIGAIDEGQADYHAAIIFPTNTALGEAQFNSVNGIDACGISRKVSANTNVSSNDAYMSCPVSLRGEIHAMGTVYAAIWWELRKKYALISDDEARQVDRLFSEHLKVLTAADSFIDAGTKIKATDAALFNNKFSTDIQNEFANRGLVLPP